MFLNHMVWSSVVLFFYSALLNTMASSALKLCFLSVRKTNFPPKESDKLHAQIEAEIKKFKIKMMESRLPNTRVREAGDREGQTRTQSSSGEQRNQS